MGVGDGPPNKVYIVHQRMNELLIKQKIFFGWTGHFFNVRPRIPSLCAASSQTDLYEPNQSAVRQESSPR
jgi:hypothetical protein